MTKFIVLLGSLSILLSSCSRNRIEPSAAISTQVKSISNFQKIDVSNAFTVFVNFSETEEKVQIEANENLHSYIIVEKDGGELQIRLKRNTSISGNARLKVYITTSTLTSIEASGASDIHFLNTLTANNLKIDLSGASSFEGDLELNHLNIEGSGASSFNLNGQCDFLQSDLSGASSIRDYGFYVNDEVQTDLSGSSSSRLTVNGDMYIEASGASSFYYKGSGIVKSQNLSGSSNIKKK